MKSRALICTDQQQFSLEEFEIPALAPTDLLIRCIYSGVSVGTEFAVFRQKLNYGPFPVCTGYQAVGIVEDIGADVTDFKIGDKVYYRRNFIPMQHSGQPLTVCSGTHASYALMPDTADVEVLPCRSRRRHRLPLRHAVSRLQRCRYGRCPDGRSRGHSRGWPDWSGRVGGCAVARLCDHCHRSQFTAAGDGK